MVRFALSLLALVGSTDLAAASAGGFGGSRSGQSALVFTVQSNRVADLIGVGAGFDGDFRQGMVCRVTRAGVDVGEILLVDVRRQTSTALILQLHSAQVIQAGDLAAFKVLKVQ